MLYKVLQLSRRKLSFVWKIFGSVYASKSTINPSSSSMFFYGFSKFLVSNISSDCFSYFIIFIQYNKVYKNIFVVPVNTESVQ